MLPSALQRLCSASGLAGSGRGAGIAAAALAVGSSGLGRLRAFSDEAGGTHGEGEPGASAAPTDEAAPAATGSEQPGAGDAVAPAAPAAAAESAAAEAVAPGLIDWDSPACVEGGVLPPELFSRRQRAWLGLGDPAKTRHFLPALSRKELGSFADEYAEEEFDVEQELYPRVPPNVPLYDLRETVPEIYEPRSALFERLQRLREQRPDQSLQEFVAEVADLEDGGEAEAAGGAPIIRWELCHVLSVGVTEPHPANKRVKARLYLRDLQRECGLTDAALQHIAAICGPRYNPHRGELKLTADRYPHREANRAFILQIIGDLVAEGHRKHPAPKQPSPQQAADAAA